MISSTSDGSREPSLFLPCAGNKPAPLVVALHTWSAERHNQVKDVTPFAERLGWNVLFPEFRGPNLSGNPRAREACGSRLAMQDIVDAVDHVVAHLAPAGAVFLVGGSGGGHMALMMAGYRPNIWTLVYASCGITDLAAWHGENPAYAPHIEACCGGPPDTPERIAEYRQRSPITYAEQIAKARVVIEHGKDDRSVPYTHALTLYNSICAIVPAARVHLDIFDGAHVLRLDHAFSIFEREFSSPSPSAGLTG